MAQPPPAVVSLGTQPGAAVPHSRDCIVYCLTAPNFPPILNFPSERVDFIASNICRFFLMSSLFCGIVMAIFFSKPLVPVKNTKPISLGWSGSPSEPPRGLVPAPSATSPVCPRRFATWSVRPCGARSWLPWMKSNSTRLSPTVDWRCCARPGSVWAWRGSWRRFLRIVSAGFCKP